MSGTKNSPPRHKTRPKRQAGSQNQADPQRRFDQTASIDAEDIARFDQLAASWWDPAGPMRPLHLFTPVRLDYILRAVRRTGRGAISPDQPLAGLRVLDIGCGGGLLAEPIARLGARLTAIDGSAEAISAAAAHAAASGLDIDYQHCSAEMLASQPGRFDLIYASEVIEHVADLDSFASAIDQLLSPSGLLVITTINRTLAAAALAKYAAEYLLRLVPAGTHQVEKFIRPDELQALFRRHHILLDDITGFVPIPGGRFTMAPITAINYGASGGRFPLASQTS